MPPSAAITPVEARSDVPRRSMGRAGRLVPASLGLGSPAWRWPAWGSFARAAATQGPSPDDAMLSSIAALIPSAQAIARAAHRMKQRAVEIPVYLLPQPADVDVDDVGLRV